MSNSNNPKDFPPDDFSATIPSFAINKPKDEEDIPPRSGYGNIPNQPQNEDWSMTQNVRSSSQSNTPKNQPPSDYGATIPGGYVQPPQQNQSQDFGMTLPGYAQSRGDEGGDWQMTQTPNRPNRSTPPNQGNYGASSGQSDADFGKTMPYFRLPQNEQQKAQEQKIAAKAEEKKAQEEKTEKEKGGIPLWAWLTSFGLLTFFFLAAVLLGIYFFFLPENSFTVLVKGAQPNSEIFVDKTTRWGVTDSNGTFKLYPLNIGKRELTIKRQGFKDDVQVVEGASGDQKEITAQQLAINIAPPDDCRNLKKGEFAKSAKCANDALDKLGDPFSVDDLLKALNLYYINFASGKSNIPPNDMKFVTRAAGFLQKIPANILIEVGGHTDNVGSKTSNQKLSEARANSVKSALVGLGVKSEVLLTKGYADNVPFASNDTEDGRFLNRRIQYSIAK